MFREQTISSDVSMCVSHNKYLARISKDEGTFRILGFFRIFWILENFEVLLDFHNSGSVGICLDVSGFFGLFGSFM